MFCGVVICGAVFCGAVICGAVFYGDVRICRAPLVSCGDCLRFLSLGGPVVICGVLSSFKFLSIFVYVRSFSPGILSPPAVSI